MVEYMKSLSFSKEAKAVLMEGQSLWSTYHSATDNHATRQEYALNRSDVGWFQVRKALESRRVDSDAGRISFSAFEKAYMKLTEKLAPQVFALGFMR